MAKADIQAKKDLSPVVKELADAKETIRRQEELIAKLSQRMDALEDEEVSEKPRRGRKPKLETVE